MGRHQLQTGAGVGAGGSGGGGEGEGGIEGRHRVERCLWGRGGCIDWSPHQILAGISKHCQRGAGKPA